MITMVTMIIIIVMMRMIITTPTIVIPLRLMVTMMHVTTALSADDYTAVMTYSGPAPPNFYSHWARLISPPVALTTNSCLSIIIAANANITILTSFLNDVGIYSERRLFSSALPLGEAWHRLRLNIAPSVPYQTFAAVIETAISEVSIVATAVAEVRLYAGICRLLG